MLISYARVSTLEQNLDPQQDDLKNASSEDIIVDKISGTVVNRPRLEQLKSLLLKGDIVIVWRLYRLRRSYGHCFVNWYARNLLIFEFGNDYILMLDWEGRNILKNDTEFG